jgi:hypothetical protein
MVVSAAFLRLQPASWLFQRHIYADLHRRQQGFSIPPGLRLQTMHVKAFLLADAFPKNLVTY